MSNSDSNSLVVRTHVGRDFLQSAALFATDKKVIWEYVANGLQYVDDGVIPEVYVRLEGNKKIIIKDNGRGMDWTALQNFFVMHGENVDRKKGRAGRGYFGTGKSAAFGIADTLRITTVRNRKRSIVQLTKQQIKNSTDENPIPVQTLEREEMVKEPNGTTIEIENLNLRSLDQTGIIKFIERNLARGFRNGRVYVNNHECEFSEPPSSRTLICDADGELLNLAGPVQLILKVATTPLEDDMVGVAILANGNLFETTLAGSENRPMSQFIFGEIDVPSLQEDEFDIPAFDQSRSLKLNRENSLVQAIMAFVGKQVDSLRRSLVKEEEQRKASEEAKKLQKEAARIAQVLNDDFSDYRSKIAKVRSKTVGGADSLNRNAPLVGVNGDAATSGADMNAQAVPQSSTGPHNGGNGGSQNPPPQNKDLQTNNTAGNQTASVSKAGGSRTGGGGGFSVEFRNMGDTSRRAVYVRAERTIYINLDHPQLVAAKGGDSSQNDTFRKFCYEIAFSEYAVALTFEFAAQEHFYADPIEPLSDLVEHIDRLARKSSGLFSAANTTSSL